MAINFHLANGAPHPWLIPKDGFDEGIDLDSLLPAVQLVLVGVCVAVLRALRRERRPATAGAVRRLERSVT
jgi:glutathione S-transferase